MSNSNTRRALPLRAGRGLVTLLAIVPLVLSGFVIGYGVGAEHERRAGTAPGTWEQNAREEHAPTVASFTATAMDGPAPEQSAVLPVGTSEDLGITVTHLQFVVDESTVPPDHTARLRLSVLRPPRADAVMLEVASVRPVGCLCTLSADTAPPYGRVWDAAFADATTTEVTFDLTGAIDSPGRYGFAVTTPDRDAYLEFEGVGGGDGPSLLTESAPTRPRARPATRPRLRAKTRPRGRRCPRPARPRPRTAPAAPARNSSPPAAPSPEPPPGPTPAAPKRTPSSNSRRPSAAPSTSTTPTNAPTDACSPLPSRSTWPPTPTAREPSSSTGNRAWPPGPRSPPATPTSTAT
ncbi:hypothetical protein GCM10029992_29860 [Glycomyces albus]